MAVDRDDIIRQFAELWWAERQNTVFRNRYLGIPTWQHPFDAWATQEIICEVRPDLIVECGSNLGGSALMWSTLLEQINPNGRIVTIDIERRVTNARLFPRSSGSRRSWGARPTPRLSRRSAHWQRGSAPW